MARIRSIKPEFWSSEQVMECSPLARLLFIGLWNFADDAGRHPLSPRQIKALVFPGDDMACENIRELIDELSSNGLLNIYAVDGKEYFEITGWRHQKIDRPQSPKYPAPIADRSSNGIDGKDEGEERKGKDSSEAIASGAKAPIDFERVAYERGKQVLGKKAGGVISRLMKEKCKTWPATVSLIEEAAGKQSPIEWVNGVLRKADPDEAIYRNVL